MEPTVESTWDRYDRPVLAAAIRYIEERNYQYLPQAYDLAEQLGLDAEEVGKALLRLNGEYIKTSLTGGGLPHAMVEKIYPAGRRAAGQWPSPEQMAEDLIARLQAAAEAEPDPEKKGKLRQTAAFLGTAGKDLFIEVLGAVVTNQAGIG
ncbi:hypothetical protein [Nonomuraea sp. NPDC023979]|uniref:hypothetical protein n=1 Tax=Nonomuraea sp. NPDC023979 TaxID=3154796 RepID=UPI0033C662D9